MSLEFSVIGKKLTLLNEAQIVTGEVNVTDCIFNFDSSWDGYTKTVVFQSTASNAIPVIMDSESNTCNIPPEITSNKKVIYIGVFGVLGGELLNTNQEVVKMQSGANPNFVAPPTEAIYLQIVNIMQSQKVDAQTAITKALEASNSADEALLSEAYAHNSEINSKTSETASKDSETKAKASETAAKTSETNAKTSENEAKAARDDAVSIIQGKLGINNNSNSDTEVWSSSKVNSQLASIANQKIGGGVLGTLNDFGQDVKEALVGGGSNVAVVGKSGVTHANLAKDILAKIGGKTPVSLGTATDGYYKSDGTVQSITTYKCFSYNVAPNEVYFISGTSYQNVVALVRYADSNGVVLSSDFVGTGAINTFTDQIIVIPANCSKMLLTFYIGTGTYTYSLSKSYLIDVSNKKIGDGITAESKDIADEMIVFSKLNTLDLGSFKRLIPTFNPGYYKSDGTYVALDAYRSCAIDCQEGDVFLYKALDYTSSAVYSVILLNSANAVMKTYHPGTSTIENLNIKINIPFGCTKALFNFRYDSSVGANYEAQINYGIFKYTTKELIVSCWGDSMTYGNQDGTGITYPSVLFGLLGNQFNSYFNCGVGGERLNAIAGRQGGLPLYVDPFAIPADGITQVTTTIRSIDGDPVLLNQQPVLNSLNPVVIKGVAGNIYYDSTNSVNKFQRLRGNSAVTLTRPTKIITQGAAQYNDGINIIWGGTNDKLDSTNVNEAILKIKSMLEYANSKKYIVIGMTAKSYMSDVVNVNKTLAHAFGRHFIDIRSYILQYGLADAGITPTTQDNTDIANGEIPTSLRTDSIHWNRYGYTILANQIYARGIELGYWS